MSALNLMLKAYEHAMSNKIKELAAPLDQCFNIDVFIYANISNQGAFFDISNQPDLAQSYFHTNLYRTNPLIRHPKGYMNGPLLTGDIPNIQQEDKVWSQFGYSMQEGLVIFKQDQEGVHKFLFNTKKRSSFSIRDFYIKNLTLLDTFCDYFLKEWHSYLHIADNYTIDIGQLIGANFYTSNCLQNWSTDVAMKEVFLKKIGVLPQDFILRKAFSPQEKVCLNLLLQGKTLKEVAEEMNLSYRTAEHYLKNIKNKTNCETKSEVLNRFRHLKIVNLV